MVSEGPDKHNNYKINLPPILQGIHPWIHSSHLRISPRPDLKTFSGLPEPASNESFTIDASGHEEWQVEKVLKDRIYRRKRKFPIHGKGYNEIKTTWEPLYVLERARHSLRTYWFETYNETFPFHLPWTQNEVWSAWTVEQPEYIPLSPELDLDGFWTPIQDSNYCKTETCYTLPSLDESQMET